MRVLRCDRCKEEGGGIGWDSVRLEKLTESERRASIAIEVELCETCARDLKRWMTMPPPIYAPDEVSAAQRHNQAVWDARTAKTL